MSGEERRAQILNKLKAGSKPVSGSALAKELKVSRQVIVQDIALIRAQGVSIYSTPKGYIVGDGIIMPSRVFKLRHREDEVEEELNTIIDNGGRVEDVFVYHKVYGILRATMNIKSRLDIKRYVKDIASGKSTLLLNLTSGYHYHTVSAESMEILDIIQDELTKKGFLAKLVDYEPVDFWNKEG